jgi:hypothetical protein
MCASVYVNSSSSGPLVEPALKIPLPVLMLIAPHRLDQLPSFVTVSLPMPLEGIYW